jgi:DNA polymerase-3 subunit delta'
MDSHKHVDTLWIEPQSKSRQIKADEIRGLVHRITQTSFEGGWKAGILVSAECMNTASANILLKTLEEPPPKTVLFLITDSPQALLPTIISRCQKIVLSKGSDGTANANWNASLMELLRDMPPKNGLAAARLAGQLKAIFDVVKAEISDAVDADFDADEGLDESKLKEIFDSRVSARLKEVQAEVFRVLLDWHRDILMLVSGVNAEHLIFSADHDVLAKQAVRHTQASILQAMEIVETMARRLERNISPVQIFDEAFRRLVRR